MNTLQGTRVFMAKDKRNNHFPTDLIPSDDPSQRYSAMFKVAGNCKIIGESSVSCWAEI